MHPRIPNAEERFRSFCSIVGSNTLQEYLDALEKLCKELEKREDLVGETLVYPPHEQRNLILNDSRGSGTHRYCDISPAKRGQAINSRSDKEAEEVLDNRVLSVIRCRRIRASAYRFPVYDYPSSYQ
ncbi:uncharacterized protein PGTG_18503 [Puccinia graminis f. sp. tritici CRL 75-36-700-3]|uniref:Uncharacterized protein n=1 Tax=Puccinia graminis f. sp. tritici (strain CRL 75-36-700-3 / race SCCL) TaxID=418459 RepID=E3KM96_PUCGT|nr:uncharacterized protein PGTG_11777 [Puccinia graminis f. sp. tritici CRL 75-36-700-3]XP_003336707.1 uncharacterized protein PGTG_18503 [Puccinia graminis f. sp. tritici CRL 75-36-700-3]EFP85421.1 hypothetical protein PGTG_11777 [Puccinia graminis f. sp. tritici CRL 75-36-700-3]EFP92288.1 hypothetical protein PGTG_18503 [Puccinia graminis f. sp. tritici CRL 75-36-700-3]